MDEKSLNYQNLIHGTIEMMLQKIAKLEQKLSEHIECTLVIAEKQHANTGAVYKDKQILRDNIKNIAKLKEM